MGPAEGPAKVRTGTESEGATTCKREAQKKATEQIQDATGDAAKSKKLFEEDLCKIWQEQLNCFGEDTDACKAAIPDIKKASGQATQAVKTLYDVKSKNAISDVMARPAVLTSPVLWQHFCCCF